MSASDLLTRMALGAAGGFVGTVALQSLLMASQKWLPAAVPPLQRDPGEFMLEQAEHMLPESVRSHIPHVAEIATARGLAVGYGVTFGALYAALRPKGGSPLLDGLTLGLACWAAGYLGWLPALKLMPPVWEHEPAQAIAPVVEHAAYGMAAVATYDWLGERV